MGWTAVPALVREMYTHGPHVCMCRGTCACVPSL